MNAIGSTEGRNDRGELLPRGPVTPQATFSPGTLPRSGEMNTPCTPLEMARQIWTYSRALSITYLPPTFLYCGDSQIGLLGSFHAVQRLTFGRMSSVDALVGSCWVVGGVQKPLYRSA